MNTLANFLRTQTSQLKKKQTGEKIEDARDLQRKRDLVEVLRIITTRFQGGPVTPEEYEWALSICKEEQELEDKELAEVMISMKPCEQDGKIAHSNGSSDTSRGS